MVPEVSIQSPENQPPPQVPSTQPQQHQNHQVQGGGILANQSQPQGTRQYTAGHRGPNRGRGYNHNNNNGRGYNHNNDRNPNYGGGVKIHYNNNMSGGGYQNQNRYPMPSRNYNNVAPNVTLAPNPSFTLSNQLMPTPAMNHYPQNQFSAISNPPVFEEPGHGLLQNPGQSFEPPQQQPNQQLFPVRKPQIQWSNGVQNGISVMDQSHLNGMEMNGLGGENTIGNYQSQQMLQQQQQFPPAQTTYYGYNQFGVGQSGLLYPNNNLNQFYGNNSAPNFMPGYGLAQQQFVNPAAGYSPYGNVAGNGQGPISFICSVCKNQMQLGADQATEIVLPEKASSATESTQE